MKDGSQTMDDTTTISQAFDEATRPEQVAAVLPVAEQDLDALHRRLEDEAADQGLLDIAYRILDTPVGPLLLAATQRGLVRVAFDTEGFDQVLEGMARRISPRVLEAPRRLDHAATELEEYFQGRRHVFDLDLDYAMSQGFRRTVQRYLPHIAYGHTSTYGAVAREVGNPRAVRAVGTACATNPLPVVVPCHRVLRTDGGLGGYIGGLDAKTFLLDLERAA